MNPFIIYIIKVNVAIAMFYLLYRILFVRDTFFAVRRVYLLAAVVVSFAYPAIRLSQQLLASNQLSAQVLQYIQLPEFTVLANPSTPNSTVWEHGSFALITLYLLVVAFLFLRMAFQFMSLMRIKRACTQAIVNNISVYITDKEISPFSFFKMIVINTALHSPNEQAEILAHEQAHVKQKHSYDVLFFEFLCIALWLNPFTWLLKREVRHNLEFLADKNVLIQGYDSRSYQYHLLQLSYHTPSLFLTNKFNILPLKKRIVMMNRSKTPRILATKYLLVVPFLFSLVFLSNAENFIQSASDLNLKAELILPTSNYVPLQTEASTQASSAEVPTAAMSTNDGTPVDKAIAVKPMPEMQVVGYAVSEVKTENQKANADAQKTDDVKKVIFQVVEKMPEFQGGDKALFKYLAENIKYPVDAQEGSIQGRVICRFVVDENGDIKDVEVVRSVHPSLDAEAVRIIKAMPKWTPGMQRGKNVNVQYTLPINFRLESDKDDAEFKPLIVIDGKVMPADFAVSTIDPNKIEEVKVEKNKDDAAKATLIQKYGERAAGGVVHITMKK